VEQNTPEQRHAAKGRARSGRPTAAEGGTSSRFTGCVQSAVQRLTGFAWNTATCRGVHVIFPACREWAFDLVTFRSWPGRPFVAKASKTPFYRARRAGAACMNDHAPGNHPMANHPVVFGGMAGMVTVARPRSRRSVTKGNPAMISTPPHPLRGLGKRRLRRWAW